MHTESPRRDVADVADGLAEGLRRREAWAVRWAAEHLLPALRPGVGRMLADSHDVDDVLQDTLVRCLERLPDDLADDAVVPWARTVALNLARDHHRERRRRPEESLSVLAHDDELLVSVEPGPESLALAAWQREEIELALAELSPRDSALVTAREVDRVPVGELADEFTLTHGAVRVTLVRIRSGLRERLEDRRLLGLGLLPLLWRRARSAIRQAPGVAGGAAAVVVAAAIGAVALVSSPGTDAPSADEQQRPVAPAADGGDEAPPGLEEVDVSPQPENPGVVGQVTGVAPDPEATTAPAPAPEPSADPAETPSAGPSPSSSTAPEPEETAPAGLQVDLEPAGVPVDVVVPLPIPCIELGLEIVSTCPAP